MMRLAIVSFAHLHAEAYIHNLRAIPGVEFIGFVDEDAARGRHFADKYETRHFMTNQELLAEKPDGVVICSENARHAELTQMAAEAGLHIICEKPLATTLADAQSMVEMCEEAGVILMTAFPMRFSAPIVEAKRALDAGHLGTIHACNSTNQGECPKYHRAWFVDKQLAGGGAVLDHTVHLADLMRWIFKSEVVEVYAQTNRIMYADEVDEDIETGGLIMLRFANKIFATIDCSWSKPPYYPTWGGLSMKVIGERGFLEVDGFRQVLTTYSHAEQRPLWHYWGSDMNQRMLQEFVDAIRDQRSPQVTGWDGYKSLEIALAAYRSAQSGQPVGLPLT
jgi:predicted dehydrogenase